MAFCQIRAPPGAVYVPPAMGLSAKTFFDEAQVLNGVPGIFLVKANCGTEVGCFLALHYKKQ